MIKRKELKFLTISLAISGLISTASGIFLNTMTPAKKQEKIKVKVIEKQVAKFETNVPKLKDITVDINQPISVDVKEYISNIEEINDSVIKKFKLDTSLVNVTQPGKYTYAITYKDKKYTGNVIVNQKKLPNVGLKLKNLTIRLNDALPNNIKDYLDITVSDEAIQTMKLDISKINTKVAGDYQYTVTYNDQLYTGKVVIYEEQPTQTLNTLNYTIKYQCNNNGQKIEKTVKISETSTTKSKHLSEDAIIKIKEAQEELNLCKSEIDKSETKFSSYPIQISNGNQITITLKNLTQEPQEQQKPTN